MVADLTPVQLHVAHKHRFLTNRDIPIKEAVEELVEKKGTDWPDEKEFWYLFEEREKEHVEENRYFRSIEEGHDIGSNEAVRDFISKGYAERFRKAPDSLEFWGFLELWIKIPHDFFSLNDTASKYDCCIYAYKEGNPGDFRLNSRGYTEIRPKQGERIVLHTGFPSHILFCGMQKYQAKDDVKKAAGNNS